jgi:hypothetical protein
MAQTTQSLALNLPDSLPREPVLLADLLKRVTAPVYKPEAKPQDTRLARAQRS